MLTNGCTYGADFDCGNHGRQSVTDPYRKPGAVTRTTKFPVTHPHCVTGKHCKATERRIKPRALTRQQSRLNATAHRKIEYDEPTVCIRKFPKEG